MGMNFYLKKKDNSNWVIPNNKLGETLELLCMREVENGNSTITLKLDSCITKTTELHIGKSSYGWHFNLCIYPTLNIYTLEDWKKLFNDDNYEIVNEEGELVESRVMLDKITNRKDVSYDTYSSQEEFEDNELKNINEGKEVKYNSFDEFLKANDAERGYNGLLRHRSCFIDTRENEVWKGFKPMYCLHIATNGTYDYTPDWDFS